MTAVLIFFHTIICILLGVVILMQSGRGGGLTEGFAPAESLFGAKTNTMMIKATTVLTTIFLITCLSLAFLSSQKDKSLMSGITGAVTEESSGAKSLAEKAEDTAGNTDMTGIPDDTVEATIDDSAEDPTREPTELP